MENKDTEKLVETTTTKTTTSSTGSFMDQLKDFGHTAWEKMETGFEVTKEKAAEGFEYTKTKVNEGYQVSKESLTNLGQAINEQLPEKIQYHPDGTVKTTKETETVYKNFDGTHTIEKEKVESTHTDKV